MKDLKKIEEVAYAVEELYDTYDCELNGRFYHLWKLSEKIKNEDVQEILKEINKQCSKAEDAFMMLDTLKDDLNNIISDNE